MFPMAAARRQRGKQERRRVEERGGASRGKCGAREKQGVVGGRPKAAQAADGRRNPAAALSGFHAGGR